MISIKKYNHKLQYEWDEFITNSEGGTIFHYQKFLNYHIHKNFQGCSLLFYEKEILVGVLPAALIKNNVLMVFYHLICVDTRNLSPHTGAFFYS